MDVFVCIMSDWVRGPDQVITWGTVEGVQSLGCLVTTVWHMLGHWKFLILTLHDSQTQ